MHAGQAEGCCGRRLLWSGLGCPCVPVACITWSSPWLLAASDKRAARRASLAHVHPVSSGMQAVLSVVQSRCPDTLAISPCLHQHS